MSNEFPPELAKNFGCLSQEVTEACNPLSTLNISFFLYTRSYADGSQTWLINNPSWEKHFHEKGLYKNDCLRIPPKKPTAVNKLNLWKCMPEPCQKIFKEAREFNIDHGITLLGENNDFTEAWHFGTRPENHEIYNLYLNKTELLERFTQYFRNEAKSLIEKAEKYRKHFMSPNEHSHAHEHTIETKAQQDIFDEFVAQTTLKRLYLGRDHGNTYLTARELECIQWLKKGKSVEEIALILDMKTSTAQSHVENIKKKFDCYKQFSLGYNIAKLDALVE